MTGVSAAHGTYAGYQTHKRRGQLPCEPCRQANAEYQRNRRTSPAAHEADLYWNRTRHRALERLSREFPRRFRELLIEERASYKEPL